MNDLETMTSIRLPETSLGSQADARMALIQQSVGQFIELQREQQQTLCCFLDFLQNNLGGAPVAGTASAMASDYTSQAPSVPVPKMTVRGGPQSGLVLPTVVPAPILPQEVLEAIDMAPMSSQQVPGKPGRSLETVANAVVETVKPDADEAATGFDDERPTTARFKFDLLRIVADRTGYPQDMLDLDAQMEADLGIDSIKRIEVFAELKDRYDFLGGRDEETVLEELSGLKTLNQIILWYGQSPDPQTDSMTKAVQPAVLSLGLDEPV